MRKRFVDIVPAMLISLFILFIFEVLNSTLFPTIGLSFLRLHFHVLLVLYLGFKLNSTSTSILVLVIEYFHSFFSVEGWAVGTFCGVIIVITINYLRDLINLTSNLLTVLITMLFYFIWFILSSLLLYIRIGDFSYILTKFWNFIPESILLSLLAPFVFKILDKIWDFRKEDGVIGDLG